jgi:8-oxo-dGTP pyrophosphatase MutT (NUDIX family)
MHVHRKRKVGVGLLLYCKHNNFVILRRIRPYKYSNDDNDEGNDNHKNGGLYPEQFQIPRGSTFPHEDKFDGAKREFKEETGIVPILCQRDRTFDLWFTDNKVIYRYVIFVCRGTGIIDKNPESMYERVIVSKEQMIRLLDKQCRLYTTSNYNDFILCIKSIGYTTDTTTTTTTTPTTSATTDSLSSSFSPCKCFRLPKWR